MSARAADLAQIERLGRSAQRRLARADAGRALARAAAQVLWPLLALLAADAALPFPFSPAPLLWVACGAWCAAWCARAWARGRPIGAVLARVDLELGLEELLSTAYQEARRLPGSEFAALLARRGAEAARGADIAAALRTRPGRPGPRLLLLGYSAALALTFAGPAYRLRRDPFLSLARALAARLEPAQKSLEAQGLRDPAARLKELRRRLAEGRLSREGALRALDELDRSLQGARADGLESAAGEMARAGAALRSDAAAALSRALRSADPGAAARALESMAKDSAALDVPRREELARELAAAARELSKSGPLGETRSGLESAAKAFGSGKPEAAREGLERAAKPLKGLEGESKRAAAAAEARGAVGEARGSIGRSEPAGSEPGKTPSPGASPGASSSTGEGGSGEEGKGGAAAPGGGGKGGPATPAPPSAGGPGSEAGGPGGSLPQAPGGFRRVHAGPGPLLTVPGKPNGSGTGTPTVTRGAPEGGPASVPYTDLLPGYKAEAEEAMRKETVPPGYRSLIRDYFQLLDPKSRKGGPATPQSL